MDMTFLETIFQFQGNVNQNMNNIIKIKTEDLRIRMFVVIKTNNQILYIRVVKSYPANKNDASKEFLMT